MRDRKIDTSSLVTHAFSLDEINEAFEVQSKPEEAVKVVIKP